MKLLGIFVIIFMILIQSVSALDTHNSIESQNSNCHTSSDCSSDISPSTHQNENSDEHSHCIFHCTPFMFNAVVSKIDFTYIILDNVLNTRYFFSLNSPILEGPFRPPLA